jgi:hypothetical protein
MTPNKITVLIDGDDGEKEAKLIKFNEMYQAALYETDDGREFYVTPELIQVSQESHEPVPIPLQVVTQRAEMLAKLAWGQEQLERLNKEKTSGLILPNGLGN